MKNTVVSLVTIPYPDFYVTACFCSLLSQELEATINIHVAF